MKSTALGRGPQGEAVTEKAGSGSIWHCIPYGWEQSWEGQKKEWARGSEAWPTELTLVPQVPQP